MYDTYSLSLMFIFGYIAQINGFGYQLWPLVPAKLQHFFDRFQCIVERILSGMEVW